MQAGKERGEQATANLHHKGTWFLAPSPQSDSPEDYEEGSQGQKDEQRGQLDPGEYSIMQLNRYGRSKNIVGRSRTSPRHSQH